MSTSASSSPSPLPSWRNLFPPPSASTSIPVSSQKNNLDESDDDLFTVPDVEEALQQTNATTAGRRSSRGRNPVDRDYRRLRRLLRNRVSAQQARERKKVYVHDLESKAEELHDQNMKLEGKISTLVNENTMLRKILMNTRPKIDDTIELKLDPSGKN